MKILWLFAFLLCWDQVRAGESEASVDITDKVFLDVAIGKGEARRIVVALFGKEVPKTAENFKQLASGKPGFGYKGTIFHRVINQFMIQGGDTTNFDGTGGRSIYNATFEDENFRIKHFRGCLSMANSGPNTNGSQFFITTADTSWLDGRHVVFGKVIEGMDVVEEIEKVETGPYDEPKQEIKLVDTGLYLDPTSLVV